MKQSRLKYFWFATVMIALVGILFYIRLESVENIKTTIYSQWQENFVVVDGEQAYVKTTKETDEDTVLSESQGYGMLITVQAAENGEASQADFDQLYAYYLDNRLADTELMSWRQVIPTSGKVDRYKHNATDGDLYIAYALIRAAEQWPEEAGTYEKQARAILEDILNYNYNKETGVLTVGNWATEASEFYNLVRTSDVLPVQFEAFYQLTGDKEWLDISDTMLTKLSIISDQSESGLIPDFIWVGEDEDDVKVAHANDISTAFDGEYYYEACRLPYNLAQSDHRLSQKIVNKMLDFFMAQERIYAGYDLDGEALNDYQSASFIAPVFFAANHNDNYRRLVQDNKYLFMQDISGENYYEATLITMVALGAL